MAKHCTGSLLDPDACAKCRNCILKAKRIITRLKHAPLSTITPVEQVQLQSAAIYLIRFLGFRGFQNFLKNGEPE